MKYTYLFATLSTLIFGLSSTFGQAGGTTCATPVPICTQQGVTFTANANGVAASTSNPGNNYGCLFTTPNPSWYYLEISQAGDIIMSLSAPQDIDFIIYGPFSNLTTAINNCGSYNNIVPNIGDPFLCGTFDICDAYGCSYDPTANENPGIPNAQVGEVYIMLVTNYANTVQQITLTQTGGTGATDCSVLQPCSFTNINANISPCNNQNNTFGITGSVSFDNPPTSGQLVISTCNGVQQTFNAPFTSPQNFSLNNIPANGQACNVTATFSATPACTISLGQFNAPTCNCSMTFLQTNISACDGLTNTFSISGFVEFVSPPNSGTLTVTDCNGNSQSFNAPFTSPTNYSLNGISPGSTTNCTVTASFSASPSCTITSNPFDYPADCDCPAYIGTFTNTVTGQTNLNSPYNLCFNDELTIIGNGDFVPADESQTNIVYDPGVWLLVYECPPTIGPTDDINDDPCLLGIASDNDAAWAIINDIGDGLTFYFVPITMYSMVDGFYSSTNSLVNCYDLGPVYPVTYLPEVIANHTTDCASGTLTATVSGGSAAVYNSQFTAQNLLPNTANFVNTSTGNNGNIVVSGLNSGDNYSFDIIDVNGCFVTISGIFQGSNPVDITYPQSQYCVGAGTVSPTITGLQGGTFSSNNAGLSINPTTGAINFNTSSPGNYVVTYQTPEPICFSVDQFNITISGSVTNTINQTICENQLPVTINGLVFNQAGQQTLNLTTAAGCDSTLIVNLTVVPMPVPTFTGANLNGCAPLTASFQNTTLGQFSNCLWNFGNGTTATGCGNVSNTYTQAGCYDVTLTVTSNQGCTASFTIDDMVCVTPAPISSFVPNPAILSTVNPITEMINLSTNAISYVWFFGDTSAPSTEVAPIHTYPEEPGTYIITLVAQNGACTDTSQQVVVIDNEPIFYVPNTFTPDLDNFNPDFQPVFTAGFDIFNYNLLIFNRWGEIIFESNNALVGWDGTYNGEICQDGTYIWQITFKEIGKDKRRTVRGHVNLLR
jgi:gliding motility-associated-like protein